MTVRIDSLVVEGFRCFSERTEIDLDPDLTALVGSAVTALHDASPVAGPVTHHPGGRHSAERHHPGPDSDAGPRSRCTRPFA